MKTQTQAELNKVEVANEVNRRMETFLTILAILGVGVISIKIG